MCFSHPQWQTLQARMASSVSTLEIQTVKKFFHKINLLIFRVRFHTLEATWYFFRKLNIRLPYDSAILLRVRVLGHFSCVLLFASLWTVACQAPLSMGLSRQEYWSGLPCPPAGDLADSGLKFTSLALKVDSLLACHQRSPLLCI